MTYTAFETSQYSGEPIELYVFSIGPDTYRYTSTEDDYEFNAQTFSAVAIQRSEVSMSGELRNDTLTIEMPGDDAFPQLFVSILPGNVANVSIFRIHRPDGVSPQSVLLYKGSIRSVAFTEDSSRASLSVVPISHQLARVIPRYTYQGLCNHFLYDARCKVTKSNFEYQGTASAESGFTVTVSGINAAKGAGWAVGGYIQLPSLEARGILAQSGDVLTLELPFVASPNGLDVSVYAGCDHTIATCKSKFDNVINYGGSAFVPLKNIFQSGIK